LFDRLIDHASTTINGIELSALTDYLRERINNYDPATIKYAQARVAHKVVSEHDRLFGAYGSSREYVTLQQFNPSDLVQWSAAFARCMTETVVCQSINELWQKCAGATVVYAHTMSNAQGDQLPTVVLNTGDVVEVVGQIDADCHDRQLLRPLLRMARARWHAACTALLYSQAAGDCLQVEEKIPVIPLMVLPDGKGKLYFVQPILPMPETLEKIKTPVYSFFGVEKVGRKCEQWRVHNNRLYLHDWSKVEHSHGGGFAYGHELSSEPIEQQGFRSAIVSNLYTQFAQAHGADKVLVTTMLERMMKDKKQSFQSNYDRWLKESNKNGYMPANAPVPVAYDYRSRDKIDNATVYAIAPEQQPGVQLYIRFIATLDMLVKDLDADFAVRRNNKDDFIAHVLLIERITLPWLFGLFCADKLFASYDDIMPVCEVE